jgi:hypothetical protein
VSLDVNKTFHLLWFIEILISCRIIYFDFYLFWFIDLVNVGKILQITFQNETHIINIPFSLFIYHNFNLQCFSLAKTTGTMS